LIANRLKYWYNSVTVGSSLGYQDIEIVNGGEIKTKIVYKFKGYPTAGYLIYDRSYGPILQRANYSFT